DAHRVAAVQDNVRGFSLVHSRGCDCHSIRAGFQPEHFVIALSIRFCFSCGVGKGVGDRHRGAWNDSPRRVCHRSSNRAQIRSLAEYCCGQTEQRRRSVLDLVDQEGQVTVADMVKRFSISAVTVRNDLDSLASIGAVVRSHGGAVRRLEATQDYPLRTKETLHRDEKIRIGRAAAELVQPGETIILDSGTTTAEVARHLKRLKIQSLTVITNALNIAVELADAPGISLIMIGGLLRPVSC